MHKVANIAYIEETESYIENHKNVMPEKVYNFISEICAVERDYHALVQKWAKEKTFFKVPEAKQQSIKKG
jgi:hypothetical protein